MISRQEEYLSHRRGEQVKAALQRLQDVIDVFNHLHCAGARMAMGAQAAIRNNEPAPISVSTEFMALQRIGREIKIVLPNLVFKVFHDYQRRWLIAPVTAPWIACSLSEEYFYQYNPDPPLAEPEEEETDHMNYDRAIFVINENVRCIEATYAPDEPPVQFKTLDETIAKDDLVIVETDTRHKFTVVKVTAVDLEVDVKARGRIAWVAGKVDLASFEDFKAKEDKMIDDWKAMERRKARRQLRADLDADEEELKALPFYEAKD